MTKISEKRLFNLILEDLQDKEQLVGVYRQDITRTLFKLFMAYSVAEAKWFIFGSDMEVQKK